jgi:hypothetical protein
VVAEVAVLSVLLLEMVLLVIRLEVLVAQAVMDL